MQVISHMWPTPGLALCDNSFKWVHQLDSRTSCSTRPSDPFFVTQVELHHCFLHYKYKPTNVAQYRCLHIHPHKEPSFFLWKAIGDTPSAVRRIITARCFRSPDIVLLHTALFLAIIHRPQAAEVWNLCEWSEKLQWVECKQLVLKLLFRIKHK